MGRRGRPRKNGSRHSNGHLKPKRAISPREVAATMPHRMGLGDGAVDPHAESELGRMLLRGDLGADGIIRELAGSSYARLWRGYLVTLAGPQAIMNGAGGGLTCAGCITDEERRYCRCSMRKAIFLEMQTRLFAVGPLVGHTVQSVVCDDQPCDRLDLLCQGLDGLSYALGLTNRRKHGQNRLLQSCDAR